MKIAVLTGGYDAENVISYKSSKNVYEALVSLGHEVYQIDIVEQKWSLLSTDVLVDKNDFTITVDEKKIQFDKCFISIHGAPAETGEIQGYLDMLKIPYTGCHPKTMAITMDKILSKDMVRHFVNHHTAEYLKYSKDDKTVVEEIEKLGFPMFIKPNSAGSSFGVSKVYKSDEIQKAIDSAFLHDDTILIEEYIEGREFAQGLIEKDGKIEVLPITELISENDFFDYEAKYHGKSNEVTPANVSNDIQQRMSKMSLEIFHLFEMKGFVRIDYLMRGKDIYFMEVNGIPGLSNESIYPQMLECADISFAEFVKAMIELK